MNEIPKYFSLGFNPQEDITAWELARCDALILILQESNNPLTEAAIKEIEEDVLRHFVVTDITEQVNDYLKELNDGVKENR